MTWSILCNLFFLYNKKRHGRILFFHTYYLLLYSTRYTFFSIICVSCTYFPLRVNWIHSIHAYHLYLILRLRSEAPAHRKVPSRSLLSVSYRLKIHAGRNEIFFPVKEYLPAAAFQVHVFLHLLF